MTSQIDPTVPIHGTPTTASVRANFQTAANEITTLQQQATGAPFLPLAGATMVGPMYLAGDPTDPRMPATKAYVDAGGTGGGGGIPDAPADSTLYGRQNGAWLHAVDTPTMNAAIAAAIATVPPEAPKNGTTYGRLNGAWSAAVTTAQMNAAISAYWQDAPNDGTPYLRLSAAWSHGVGQSGTALASVIENTTGADKTPTLSGNQTATNGTSDGIRLQARRLGSPGTGGVNGDGPYLTLFGPSVPTLANSARLATGNNTAGFKAWNFNADGSWNAPGALTINAGGFGLQLASPSGQMSRTRWSVTGGRSWSAGCDSTGFFSINDETSTTISRLNIDQNGLATFNGQVSVNNNASLYSYLGGRNASYASNLLYGSSGNAGSPVLQISPLAGWGPGDILQVTDAGGTRQAGVTSTFGVFGTGLTISGQSTLNSQLAVSNGASSYSYLGGRNTSQASHILFSSTGMTSTTILQISPIPGWGPGDILQCTDTGGTRKAGVNSSGTVFGTGPYVDISSFREMKSDVEPIPDPVPLIKGLHPVAYYHDGLDADHHGFLIEDLVTDYPEAVVYDADGAPEGYSATIIIAGLTAALQEVIARVEALEGA